MKPTNPHTLNMNEFNAFLWSLSTNQARALACQCGDTSWEDDAIYNIINRLRTNETSQNIWRESHE